MKHIELVQEVGQNAGLTVEEIEKYRMDAIAKDDYIMLAFLSAAQIYEGEKERT